MSHISISRLTSFLALAVLLPAMVASCSGRTSPAQSEADRLRKAIADYTEAIRLDPNKVDDRGELAYHKRGTSYAQRGEHDQAIADYTEAIRLYPLVKAPLLPQHLAEVYNARASSYQKTGAYDKAIADYTEVIQIAERGAPSVGDALLFGGIAASGHYKRGVCYDEKGEHEKAIADYKEAVRLAPELGQDEELKRRMGK
jgi:tetratricopeptide (TPR) repeat protein